MKVTNIKLLIMQSFLLSVNEYYTLLMGFWGLLVKKKTAVAYVKPLGVL